MSKNQNIITVVQRLDEPIQNPYSISCIIIFFVSELRMFSEGKVSVGQLKSPVGPKKASCQPTKSLVIL